MSEQQYDIFFRGEVQNGFELETVKNNVGKLFKASPEKIEQLFSGKVIPLKKDLDKATAAKFKQALENAGAKIYIKLAAGSTPETTASSPTPITITTPAITTTKPATPANTTSTGPKVSIANDVITHSPAEGSIGIGSVTPTEFVILPPGSDVLREDERPVVKPVKVDISGIRMASVFDSVEIDKAPPPRAPDVSHISAAPVGADILGAVKKVPPPPAPDVSHISAAPVGADLAELVPKKVIPPAPDTSFLSTAEVGADLLEGILKEPPPPAPDISHIKLA